MGERRPGGRNAKNHRRGAFDGAVGEEADHHFDLAAETALAGLDGGAFEVAVGIVGQVAGERCGDAGVGIAQRIGFIGDFAFQRQHGLDGGLVFQEENHLFRL